MRTPSGTLHVVDFQTEQIVSAIQSKDYRDDKRHWEIKNNIDTLEFKVFDNTEHAATLMQQNLVLKEVRDGRIVPYVITEVEKDSGDRSVITYASGEWIQLAKSGIINPQKLEGKTVNELLDMALVGTKWKRGETEYSGFHSMTIDEFIDPLSFLKKIASLFELEIQYRAEVVGSQIVGRYVDMVKKRGRETGKEVTLGKDLMGVKRIENSQSICTALLGFVKKEGGDFITISSINNGVPYLVDNDAFQRWNERGQHKFGFYTPETEEDITPQRLMTLMKTEHKKRVNTSVSYEVQAQSIGRVFGLSHELINEGDTIRIKDTGFTPKLYLEARAIAGDESFTDPTQDKYVFGDYREIVDANEELRKLYNKILGSLGSKANKELVDQLEELANKAQETANTSKQTADNASATAKAAKDIADSVAQKQKDFQTKIIKSTIPPPDPIKDLTLWLDITDPTKPILYLWDGTKWDRLTPDTSIIDSDIKGIEDEIKKLQTEVGSKVNQQWVKDQIQTDIKNKADIKDVYKKTEIDQALQGHVKVQSYEIDKKSLQEGITTADNKAGTAQTTANNANSKADANTKKIGDNDAIYIKRFTENETKITQTEKDIKTQIEQLSVTNKKVDSQGNTIDAVQKKTNEIIQDANGTKQKITELTTTMENQLATSRNVLDNSDFEADLEGWKVMGGANVKVTVGKFAEGNNTEMPGFNKYVRIERTGEQGDIWIYRDLQMPLGDGIISMWSRTQANAPTNIPALGLKDNADGLTGDPGVKYFISNVPGEMRDGKWHQFHLNLKAEHGKVRVYFGQRQGTPVGSVVYITGVKLAQGNVKDNWSKSPGDMTTNTEFVKKTAEIINSVDQVSSKLSKTEQTVTTVSSDVKKAQETANNASTAAQTADKKAQEAQTQITATNKKVSEVAQTVDGLQVNISNVTKIQTQQGNDIKNAQTELQKQSSQIKANADAIATKVSAEYVQDYTGGLGINNKFRDADFSLASDKNLKYWEVNKGGDGNVEFLKGGGHEGFNSCRVTGRADSTQAHANYSHFFAAGEIVGEVDYVVSVYAFAEKAPAFDKYASVHFNYHRSDGTQINQEGKQLNLAVGAHIKTDVPFKPPAGTVRTRIRFYVAGVGFVVRFSKPMVTNGKTGTTFTLNPKDYTDYDKLVDDIADRVLTEDYDKKMTEMNTQFTQTSKALELKAETKNVYTKNEVDSKDDAIVENMNSQFKIQSDEISSKVAKGSIISSINQSAEMIMINARRIDLKGYVTADHIKAGKLEGVVLQTAPSSENRYVQLNKQDIRLFDGNEVRGYWGFYNQPSGALQPTFILGRNADAGIVGSFVMNQVTPKSGTGYDFNKSYASIGVASTYDAVNNEFKRDSEATFYKDGRLDLNASTTMQLISKDEIILKTKGTNVSNVQILPTGMIYGKAGQQVQLESGGNQNVFIKSAGGYWGFPLVNKPGGQNDISFNNNGLDADLKLAYVCIRASHVEGYQSKLQIKNWSGSSFYDVECNTLWYSNLAQKSSRDYKTGIKDIEVDVRANFMSLKAQQYYLKTDMEKLYEMRENRLEGEPLPTTADIPLQYGFIAEDSPDIFTMPGKKAISMYNVITLTVDNLQKTIVKQDEQEGEISILKSIVATQEDRIARLEELLLQQLINKKQGQS